jgi:lantibiotic modifying enzyme
MSKIQWNSLLKSDKQLSAWLAAENIACNVNKHTLSGSQGCSISWSLLEHATMAILCEALNQGKPGNGYDLLAHKHLSAAVQNNSVIGSVALFGGLCQIGMAAHYMNGHSGRYSKLLASIDGAVNGEARRLAAHVRMLAAQGVVRFSDYDVITGLSGVAAYLLSRVAGGSSQSALEEVIETLIDLVKPDNMGVFKLRTSHSLIQGFLSKRAAYSNGIINCGMAHGVTGVLASLSLAYSADLQIPELRNSIRNVADWLTHAASVSDEWGDSWPDGIGISAGGTCNTPADITMDAWCYGAPGIARAIWLAGRALGDSSIQSFATSAMEASLKRHRNAKYQSNNPAICHGYSGLLLIALRFYQETNLESFRTAANDVFEQLMALQSNEHSFGFRDPQPNGQYVDDARFLSGASGIALVLLAACSEIEPSWDRMLLLS